MAKYSTVVLDECIACGVCNAMSPEIFELNDEGLALNVYGGDNNTGTVEFPADLHAELTDTAESCPTEAIKVQDTPFA